MLLFTGVVNGPIKETSTRFPNVNLVALADDMSFIGEDTRIWKSRNSKSKFPF